MLLSSSKFFKENKIACAGRVSDSYTKVREKSCYYLYIMYIKKTSQKVKTDEILKASANLHTFITIHTD